MTLDQLGDLIEESLEKLCPPQNLLWEAAGYSLFSGGKRLRPLLTIAAVADLEGDIGSALHPACALELIHTYSLIHDDLPAMDNDDFRRNKPTLHRVYNEGHAILTGDFLLTYAFEILVSSPGLTPQQRLDLIKVLSLRAGAFGMIGGQVADIASKGKEPDALQLHHIHLGKTAALIIASLEFAAILCNLPPSEQDLLAHIGKHLGLAFQIRDDLLDRETIGEPSAAMLYGQNGAEKLIESHFKEAETAFNSLSCAFTLLRQISFNLAYRNK